MSSMKFSFRNVVKQVTGDDEDIVVNGGEAIPSTVDEVPKAAPTTSPSCVSSGIRNQEHSETVSSFKSSQGIASWSPNSASSASISASGFARDKRTRQMIFSIVSSRGGRP